MLKKSITILVLVSVLVVPFLTLKRHRSESVESAELELSVPYIRATMGLGKKESLERIVASGGAELVSREWEEFDFGLRKPPRLYSWELKGRGRFIVKGHSSEFKGEATMIQRVEIDREGVSVHASMENRSGFVSEYETDLSVTNSKRPLVRVKSRIVYERIVPFWMCDDIDRKVIEYNKSRLESMVESVRSATEK